MENNNWHCNKCNNWFGNHIDIDYHENKEHPDFNNKYVLSWYKNNFKGLSPYD